MKEPKSMTELKKVKNSVKNVENDYIRLISQTDEATAKAVITVTTENGWIATEIDKRARLVAIHTGQDFDTTRDLVAQQFVVNVLNNLEKDAKLLKSTIKYSSDYVQKVVFSDMAKQQEAKWGTSFIQADGHVDNSCTVAIDSAKAMAVDALLDALIKRKDQKEFIKTVLMHGADKAGQILDLEPKEVNRKIERALASIEKGRSKDEYKYMMSLMGEILETSHSTELTEQEELEAVYAESISIF